MDICSIDQLINQLKSLGLNDKITTSKNGYPIYRGQVIKNAVDFNKLVQREMSLNNYYRNYST